MTVDHREVQFETDVVRGLCEHQGYLERSATTFDRTTKFIPEDMISFVQETQPREWSNFVRDQGGDAFARKVFINRVRKAIDANGTLSALRNGVSMIGARFYLCAFRPATNANPDAMRAYEANRFAVMRQVPYSEKRSGLIDIVLFINGIPVVTKELKNLSTGSSYETAIKQYQQDRKPTGETLLTPNKGALIHLAIDPNQAWMTTALRGEKTAFHPFNRGRPDPTSFGEMVEGNPDVEDDYRISYLYRDDVAGMPAVFSKQGLLDIIGTYCSWDNGRLIWPRYHQYEATQAFVSDLTEKGVRGQNYLFQHSAGSGKSNTIAWVAHKAAGLHGPDGEPLFSGVVIVTDRVNLDRQLQDTVSSFETSRGYVQTITGTSSDLAKALKSGARIIISTIQKFSTEAMQDVQNEDGKRFLVIIDEAHCSQSGKHSANLKGTLGTAGEIDQRLDEIERDLVRMQERRRSPNISMAAFTATPRNSTVEQFGTRNRLSEKPVPFHSYSMRQAIEEGYIKDVLANYMTVRTYYNLHKSVEDDPRLRTAPAMKAIKQFANTSWEAAHEKCPVVIDHMRAHVLPALAGRGKAMWVCDGREHALRTYLALKGVLEEEGATDVRPVIAFSGTLSMNGAEVSESHLNGFSETKLPERFGSDERGAPNLLIVADKYQTGFDQPKLIGMYVDKPLHDIQAVQTLSRLNRVTEGKRDVFVLDFRNSPETIREAFAPYYNSASVSAPTDVNQIYDLKDRIMSYRVFADADVKRFVETYLDKRGVDRARPRLENMLNQMMSRYDELHASSKNDFRQTCKTYTRFYGFVSQMARFRDVELEMLNVVLGWLNNRLLNPNHRQDPRDVINLIALDGYELGDAKPEDIGFQRGKGKELDPISGLGAGGGSGLEQEARLSEILSAINDATGTTFTRDEMMVLIDYGDANAGVKEMLLNGSNDLKDVRKAYDKSISDSIRMNHQRFNDLADTLFTHKDILKRVQDYGFSLFQEKNTP